MRWLFSEENEKFTKKIERETHCCDWSPQHESRFLCFLESNLLNRIRKRREQRCSLLEKAKKQRMERERAIGVSTRQC